MIDDNLPTTREEWEHIYPELQSRFLAWCHDTRTAPVDGQPLHEFIAWVGRKAAAYRYGYSIPNSEPLGARQDDFTNWLWGDPQL